MACFRYVIENTLHKGDNKDNNNNNNNNNNLTYLQSRQVCPKRCTVSLRTIRAICKCDTVCEVQTGSDEDGRVLTLFLGSSAYFKPLHLLKVEVHLRGNYDVYLCVYVCLHLCFSTN